MSRRRIAGLVTLSVVVLTMGLFYRYVASGGMIARQTPSSFETFVARMLVEIGIHHEAKEDKNPLPEDPAGADVAAGRELYGKNCEACHGFDGTGKTPAGSGLYPPPADLSRAALAARKRTDGELYYLIRNGVRNTGMPGFQLPDRDTWQLVSYLRALPITAAREPAATPRPSVAPTYVGSSACKACHADLYARWAKTPMANVVRDPREHEGVIIPDLSIADPLVTFTKDDIALVYGSIWKQRYFKKVGDDYVVLPAQWDVTHRKWKPYFVKDDWWVAHYPPDNFQRFTGPLCDGCHSVNYDVEKKTVTEWNVGCERCHGPGGDHVKRPSSSNIVNPTRLDCVAGNDVCVQCHSQGRPLTNPIADQWYDWPVGYDVTRRLSDFWGFEEHRLGETTFTHFADGTAHKNRMQGNDFARSAMYTHGVTCFTCHDSHGTEFASNLRKPADKLCLDCHAPGAPNGPRAPTLAEHTHHAEGSEGSACVACHMPKIAQTLGDVNVRSHTFRFVSPASTESMKVPNACNACHADKTPGWATAALKSWRQHSPWRLAE